MVKLCCSACDRIRARVHLPSEAGAPDMTIGRAAADRAGVRRYLRRRPPFRSVLIPLASDLQKTSTREILRRPIAKAGNSELN